MGLTYNNNKRPYTWQMLNITLESKHDSQKFFKNLVSNHLNVIHLFMLLKKNDTKKAVFFMK